MSFFSSQWCLVLFASNGRICVNQKPLTCKDESWQDQLNINVGFIIKYLTFKKSVPFPKTSNIIRIINIILVLKRYNYEQFAAYIVLQIIFLLSLFI